MKDGVSITKNEILGIEEEYDNKVRRKVRGDMLKLIRLKKGYNQTQMAKVFDMTLANYNLIENGKSDMTFKRLDKGLHKLRIGVCSIIL